MSVLPNGPVYHPTVNAFMAGGVPEVMLHLRSLGLLHEDVMTVTGSTLKETSTGGSTPNGVSGSSNSCSIRNKSTLTK